MGRWRRPVVGLGIATGLAALAGVTAAASLKLAARRWHQAAYDQSVLEPVVFPRITVPMRDGETLSVVRAGAGPPLVLSHGVTLSLRVWKKQLDALSSAGFEVVAYDQRGHGQSGIGSSGHAVRHFGEDLRAVLETLDLRNAVLVGHSMGGIAVQSLLLDHPEVAADRVSGVVLVSTLARVPYGSYATRFKERIERISDRAPDATRVWESRDLGVLLARFGFGDEPDGSHLELARQMMLECQPKTRLESPRSLVGTDFADRLGEISVPTLVMCGTRDLVTPLGSSRLLAERIPHARLEVFEGSGHMLMLESPERFDRLVLDFAAEVTAGRPARPDASAEPA